MLSVQFHNVLPEDKSQGNLQNSHHGKAFLSTVLWGVQSEEDLVFIPSVGHSVWFQVRMKSTLWCISRPNLSLFTPRWHVDNLFSRQMQSFCVSEPLLPHDNLSVSISSQTESLVFNLNHWQRHGSVHMYICSKLHQMHNNLLIWIISWRSPPVRSQNATILLQKHTEILVTITGRCVPDTKSPHSAVISISNSFLLSELIVVLCLILIIASDATDDEARNCTAVDSWRMSQI